VRTVGDEPITAGRPVMIRLFGELELQAAGQSLEVGTPRQQTVLAALIVDAGRPVSVEALVDRVWDENPPHEARNVLYSHLSRIRRLLVRAAQLTGEGPMQIRRQHAGYVLDIDKDLVDIHRFNRLVDHGSGRQRSDVERARTLGEALELWRAPPLTALHGRWVAQVRDSWQRRRLNGITLWAQAELRLGHPTALLDVLYGLVVEHPLVETLEVLLMRALHAAGRSAEAVDRYAAVRQRLSDDLGIPPGVELSALHQAILRGELTPPPGPEPAVVSNRSAEAPAQLPPDLHGFTGRDHELQQLDRLISSSDAPSTAVVVCAVAGTAGIGKTTLAVHWAHRVRERFPDGQLYVNLRGFDPTGSPVLPAEAVRRFLDAFDVPPQQIPAAFEAQVSLYRSLLASRRVLVVLDNARDAAQVRPLLPGGSGCMALVTSRNRLPGLVAEGARPLTLDLMSIDEAREMLARRLGPSRVTAEPRVVDEIIDLCARLPIALAVVAARAATHPAFPLAVLVRELRETRGSLDTFAGIDSATDARTVFSWSYRQQSPAAARLFRLLGLHPGPDIAIPAAASLAGLRLAQARLLLAELAEAYLITEHAPGRYTFHDLLRAYAAEQARTADPEDQRRAAVRRILDHYLHSAHAAAQLLHPTRDPIVLAPPSPDVAVERPADHRLAMAWFTAEHAVLLRVIDHAVHTGMDTHTWQLAWTLADFLDRRGHWHDGITTFEAALRAAQRLADPRKQAGAHRLLAPPCVHLNRLDDADRHLRYALELYELHGDRVGQADIHTAIGFVLERQGRDLEALDHTDQALKLYQAADHRRGYIKSLNNIGWSYARLGDHRKALTFCEQALTQHQELGNLQGQAATLNSIGYAHGHLGDHDKALTCFRQALELFQELGDIRQEAVALIHLGNTYVAAGDTESADVVWRQAHGILEQLEHHDAESIQTKLRQIGRTKR